MNERLEVGGLAFEVRRSPRRKTLGITVDRGGELVLHAPMAATGDELARWAGTKLLWVHRKLALKEEVAPRVRKPEFVSGETFRYLGRAYRLTIVSEQEDPLRLEGERFRLRRDARKDAETYFRRWYISKGTPWLARRAALLARKVVGEPTKVEVRDLGYRWGSCGKNGSLYFNWRLLQFPVRIVDYVVIHELIHLEEPRHGPEFRRALDRALPDWRQRESELTQTTVDVFWV